MHSPQSKTLLINLFLLDSSPASDYWCRTLYQDVVCNDSKKCNNSQLMNCDSQRSRIFLKYCIGVCNIFLVSRNLKLTIRIIWVLWSNCLYGKRAHTSMPNPVTRRLSFQSRHGRLPDPFHRRGLHRNRAAGNQAHWLQCLPTTTLCPVALEILPESRHGKCRHNSLCWSAQKQRKLWIRLINIFACDTT